MKQIEILVRSDASKSYVNRQMHSYSGPINWEWAKQLAQLQGQWIEVETDFLFKNQFNTVPIPGVSESGLRLGAIDCDKIRFLNGFTYEDYLKRCNDFYLKSWNESVNDLPAIKSLM